MSTNILDLTNLPNSTVMNESSIGTEKAVQNQTGGFFWSKTGCTDVDDKIFIAVKNKNYTVINFMIENSMVGSYKCQDSNKKTILHYLIEDRKFNSKKALSSISKILTSSPSQVKKFINLQDNNGNTPLITAVSLGYNDIADLLINAGADKSKKNKEGLSVNTAKVASVAVPVDSAKAMEKLIGDFFNGEKPVIPDTIKAPENNPIKIDSAQLPSAFSATILTIQPEQQNTNSLPNRLSDTIAINNTNANALPNRLSDTIGATQNTNSLPNRLSDTIANTNTNALPNRLSDTIAMTNINTNSLPNRLSDTIATIGGGGVEQSIEDTDVLIKQYLANQPQTGGTCSNKPHSDTIATEELIKRVTPQFGGKNFDTRSTDLSRMISRQGDDIHKRVIEKIMKLMKLNEKDAKVYKAALWRQVTEKHPEIKSNLDKSLEMEKLTTKKNLDKIDFKKTKKEIEEHFAKKKANKKSKKPATKTSTKTSTKAPKKSSAKAVIKRSAKQESSDISDTSSAEYDTTVYSQTSESE